jgi:Mg-chelatase subunit ChlD
LAIIRHPLGKAAGLAGIQGADVWLRRRMDAWRSVFEKTDRIVSGKPINVRIVEAPATNLTEAPGWTNGDDVFLNKDLLERELQKGVRGIESTVIGFKGVNYHELSHILLSPRLSDDISKRILDNAKRDGDFRWWYAFNALEDQRIETGFVSMFPPAARYFEVLAAKWLVDNPQQLAEAHILIHGRKFLPADLRYRVRQAFVQKYSEDLADRFEKVIDGFLPVVFPNDSVKAQQAVRDYRQLLLEMEKLNMGVGLPELGSADNDPRNIPDPRQKGREDLIRNGRANVRDQKRAKDAAKPLIAEAKKQDELQKQQPQQQPGQPGDGEGEGAEGEGFGQGQGQGDGDGDSGQKSNIPQSGGDTSIPGGGNGVSNDTGPMSENGILGPDAPDPLQQAMEKAQEALDDAMADPMLMEDIKATVDSIRAASNADGDVAGQYGAGTMKDVDGARNGIVRRLRHALEDIRLDLEPTWNRRENSGKVNMRRVLQRQPHEIDIFDHWYEGSEEEGGVEAVILIDLSGSMQNTLGQASEALWIVKRAFDELDVRTTVLGFSSTHTILYRPNEKAPKNQYKQFHAQSATEPTSALVEARNVLSNSHQPNTVLITITDGQWGGSTKAEALVVSMRQAGTVTLLLGLDGAVRHYGKHQFELAEDIRSVNEIPKIAQTLVAAVMRKADSQRVGS